MSLGGEQNSILLGESVGDAAQWRCSTFGKRDTPDILISEVNQLYVL